MEISQNIDLIEKIEQEIDTDLIKAHPPGVEFNPIHGWISPEGKYHYMKPMDCHHEFIHSKLGLNNDEAREKGWVSIAHSGENNIGIHKDTLENPNHPAVKKVRELIGKHWNNLEVNGKKVDVDHFIKHGKIRPHMESFEKNEDIDLVKEQWGMDKLNKIHGWISPEGKYHHMKPDDTHHEWIKDKLKYKDTTDHTIDPNKNNSKAHDEGWISVGHGGYNGVGMHEDFPKQPNHPAMKKLRELAGKHWHDKMTIDTRLHHYGNVDIDHFVKHGKIREKLEEPVEKNETDLIKGSLQRRMPFKPFDPRIQELREKQRDWTILEHRNIRSRLPRMEGPDRQRALRKLMVNTEVRKHPETGERLYLMHRGMHPVEKERYHKDNKTNYPKGYKDSWTPDYHIATMFAGDTTGASAGGNPADNVISAWIPESALHYNPRQYNVPEKKQIIPGKRYYPSLTEKQEHEWIINHNDQYHHANLDVVKPKTDIHTKINKRFSGGAKWVSGEFGVKALNKEKNINYHNEEGREVPVDSQGNIISKINKSIELIDDLQKSAQDDYLKMYKPEQQEQAKPFIDWAHKTIPNQNWKLWAIRNHRNNPNGFTKIHKRDLEHFSGMQFAPEIANVRFEKNHTLDQGLNILKQKEQEYVNRKSKDLNLASKPETAKKILDVGNNMAWWSLGKGSCRSEGAAMGHCGNVPSEKEGDNIYSLRTEHKLGKKIGYEPHLTFVENNGVLDEMKGRGNQKPSPHYHKAIKDLISKTGFHPAIGMGYLPGNNFNINDLDNESKKELALKHPHLKLSIKDAKIDDSEIEYLNKWISDKHPGVRWAMAKNPNLDPRLHKKLANDEHPDVRWAMAKNPSYKKINKAEINLINENIDLIKEQWVQDKLNPVHGWISPEGKYHQIGHEDTHNAWMRDNIKDTWGRSENSRHNAYRNGWIHVGSGGYNNAYGHEKILNDPQHPATKKLRELTGKHWDKMTVTTYDSGDPQKSSLKIHNDIDAHHFSKFGKFKPHIDDPINKEEIDLVKEQYMATTNLLHGWISPKGKYHPIKNHEHHSFWIHNHLIDHNSPTTCKNASSKEWNQVEDTTKEAHKKGWISVGHGGDNNIKAHTDILDNPNHPAVKTLRNLVGKHWDKMYMETNKGYSGYLDTQHFSKFGKFKPHIDDPINKAETIPLVEENKLPELKKPFKSQAQRAFAHIHPEKFGGEKGVKEWESHTPSKLPKKLHKQELKRYEKRYGKLFKSEKEELLHKDENIYWHGSPSGNLKGGPNGLHLGTKEAAKQALEARIGAPAEGEWDGTRKYGETLLAGKKRLKEKGIHESGHNCDAPEHDYYLKDHPKPPKYGDNTPVHPHSKPEIAAYKLKGAMSNTPSTPHKDSKANSVMRGQITQKKAKKGYYYTNEGEDHGSLSIVVPHHSHVEKQIKKEETDLNKTQWIDPKESKENPLHGWISPEGQYHHMNKMDDHIGYIAKKVMNNKPYSLNDTYKKGWIAIGHGGSNTVSIHPEISNQPNHPAMKKLRELTAKNWSDPHKRMDIFERKTNDDFKLHNNIDVDHFIKHGKIKPKLNEPIDKSENIDLVKEQYQTNPNPLHGWISPEGEYHHMQLHSIHSFWLADHTKTDPGEKNTGNLRSKGWISVGHSGNNNAAIHEDIAKQPNHPAMKKLRELSGKHWNNIEIYKIDSNNNNITKPKEYSVNHHIFVKHGTIKALSDFEKNENIDLIKEQSTDLHGKPVSAIHGWISPTGEYHHMEPEEKHHEWIKNNVKEFKNFPKDQQVCPKAHEKGWVSLAHSGIHAAYGHEDTFKNPNHPAIKTLRKLVAKHWPKMFVGILNKKGFRSTQDIDVDHFIKHGKIKPHMEEPVEKSEKIDLVKEQWNQTILNPIHGWISPEGKYHHLHKELRHDQWIGPHIKTPEDPEERASSIERRATREGWIGVGSAGTNNALLHENTANNPNHPAMKTLRDLVGKHWHNIDIDQFKENPKKLETTEKVDVEHFIKHGKIRKHIGEPKE